MRKHHYRHNTSHLKKLAVALAGATMLSAALIPVMHAPQQQPAETQQAETPTPPDEANAKQVLDVKATAYAPGPHDNDQWGNKTRLGTEIRPGVIAVDPRIIPLGSHVMIKYPDGSKEYAVAEDTGGAIKGHRIDVAKWTVHEANRFGIKPVRIYVLNDNSNRHEDRNNDRV